MPLSPSSPVTALRGIGPAKEKAFARLGIYTVKDLLLHVPRGYEDRGNIRSLAAGADGEVCSFLLTVGSEPRTARIRRDMSITKMRVFDETGSVEVVFFNQDYLRSVFSVGDVFRFTGRLTLQKRAFQLVSPKFERVEEGVPLPSIYPVYRLCEGLNHATMSKAAAAAVTEALPEMHDHLPEHIRRKYKLPTLQTALKNLHMPIDFDEVKAALRRLSFDELFLFSLGMALSKDHVTGVSAHPFPVPDTAKLLAHVPFTLTGAQKRVCNEIAADLRTDIPMNRILVGDVGCGKTICAAFAAFTVMEGGGQVALMAPTEILARQHYNDLAPMFEKMGYQTALLLGSTPQKEKRRIYEALSAEESDRISLVIGTHALLNEKISFSSLGLVVTDEQHRFGVLQRAALRERCPEAHLLVMSATPIPRTLALVLYGDLDICRIDEMPKGRERVETFVVNEGYRERLYAFVRKQVEEGGQVYVVCPAIEKKTEEEALPDIPLAHTPLPLKTVAEVQSEMKRALPELPIAYLHGKMKAAEKESVMRSFVCGETRVLVSTTVIEVGVNVPSATLMIVEGADRFGLAQLHQLRGRVGRGSRKSYCILVSDAHTTDAKRRLETMRTTYDGYLVAEEDLKQRGPGDFLAASGSEGVRQSGGLSFRFASLCEDTDLLSAAAEETRAILSLPEEEKRQYQEKESELFKEVARRFDETRNLLS